MMETGAGSVASRGGRIRLVPLGLSGRRSGPAEAVECSGRGWRLVATTRNLGGSFEGRIGGGARRVDCGFANSGSGLEAILTVVDPDIDKLFLSFFGVHLFALLSYFRPFPLHFHFIASVISSTGAARGRWRIEWHHRVLFISRTPPKRSLKAAKDGRKLVVSGVPLV